MASELNVGGITTTGNVGIGKAPANVDAYTRSLEVKGGTAAQGAAIYVGNEADENSMRLSSWNGNGYIMVRGEKSLYIGAHTAHSALVISSAGAVTMPSTPAFSAMPSTNQNNLAADTYTDIVLATEIFDQGANFASNTFTAPVAGRYQFSALIAMNYIDSAANFYQIRIVTSNRTYSYTFDPDFGQDAIYWEGGPSILADMDASDTAKVEFYQSGGTAQTDIVATRTVFTGFLAC
jgi:hypothetical protein